jgi:hypothetical protein
MTLDISTAYLHCAVVRRSSSGRDYLVETYLGGYWVSPLEGDKIGAPVTKKFLVDNFELVKESPYDAPR